MTEDSKRRPGRKGGDGTPSGGRTALPETARPAPEAPLPPASGGELSGLVAAAPVLLLAADADGAILHADGGVLETLGLDGAQLVGKSLFDQFAPFPALVANARRALGGEPTTARAELPGSSGPVILEIHWEPARDRAGRPLVVVVATDVTGRDRAERELRESEQRFRFLSEAADAGIAIHDKGTILLANDRLGRMVGIPAAELVGRAALELAAPETRELAARMIAESREEPYDGWILRADGSRFRARIGGRQIPFRGRMARVTAIRDITEEAAAGDALRAEQDRARQFLDVARVAMVALDREGRVTLVNRRGVEILGSAESEILGADWIERFLPEKVRARVRRRFDEAMAGQTALPELSRVPIRRGDGEERMISWRNTILRDPAGGIIGTLSSGEDVTDRLRAEEGRNLLESAIQRARDGIVILVPDHVDCVLRVRFLNEGFCRITGVVAEKALGKALDSLLPLRESAVTLEQLFVHVEGGSSFETEITARRPDGTRYDLGFQLTPVFDPENRVSHWIGIFRDVTERKMQIAALERHAFNDSLTGLPNRTLMQDRLEQAIRAAEGEGREVALLLLDLDRFKEINDALSHEAGDRVLREVARRLAACVRPSETVARLGGDEFAILLPRADGEAAAEAARRLLEQFEKPIDLVDGALDVTASIGISLAPHHGSDWATLLRRADVAMYGAKSSAAGFAVYSPNLDPHSPDRLALLGDLRHAIERGQLRLHYQPKVSFLTGEVRRVEALVRWLHPERGMIGPDQFLPAAERTGLIRPITDWVLDEALRQCRAWKDAGIDLRVAVNVSTRNLQDPALPELIGNLLRIWSLDPSTIKLEITESSIMVDPANALSVLTRVRALGVGLSVDDFGTGYSSLAYLKKLPVDEIKIDKSFVFEMAKDENDMAIVRSTIDLGHNLGRRVVAEGIEDETTWQLLGELGCDLGQGYWLSRPLPADQLVAWLGQSRWSLPRASN